MCQYHTTSLYLIITFESVSKETKTIGTIGGCYRCHLAYHFYFGFYASHHDCTSMKYNYNCSSPCTFVKCNYNCSNRVEEFFHSWTREEWTEFISNRVEEDFSFVNSGGSILQTRSKIVYFNRHYRKFFLVINHKAGIFSFLDHRRLVQQEVLPHDKKRWTRIDWLENLHLTMGAGQSVISNLG